MKVAYMVPLAVAGAPFLVIFFMKTPRLFHLFRSHAPRPLFRAYLLLAWWPFCHWRRLFLRATTRKIPCRDALFIRMSGDGGGGACEGIRVPIDELPPRSSDCSWRIVAVSDTHGYHDSLVIPDGDLLVHCGDILLEDRGTGDNAGIRAFAAWLDTLPHRNKLVIGGNHDQLLQDLGHRKVQALLGGGVNYLCNSAVRVRAGEFGEKEEELLCFGSGYSLPGNTASENTAFQSKEVLTKMRLPKDLDVLITHGPPAPASGGCGQLATKVAASRPRLHIWGHMHQGYGLFDLRDGTLSVNAASVDACYGPTHPPIVVDLPREKRRL